MQFVRPIDLTTITKDEIESLWDHVSREDEAFDDFTRGRPDMFVANLMMPGSQHFWIDDSGYAGVSAIQVNGGAFLKLITWRAVPAQHLTEELLRFLFDQYNLYRITMLVAEHDRKALRLATLMRFRFEGDVRGGFLFHGRHLNCHIYGLLRSEYKNQKRQILPKELEAVN